MTDPYAEPNLLLRGVVGSPGSEGLGAGIHFEEVLPRGGTHPELIATSRAAAFGDIDNDGGIDIVIVNRDGPAHLLRNVHAERGHWIKLRVLDEHGRDALGATVTMRVGERTVRRDVRSAYSYLAANDPRVHVGLGAANEVRDVTVRWPDGAKETFGAFSSGKIHDLKRGAGGAE